MPTSKKIFIGSSVLFALLLIFLGIYNLSFKKGSSEETIISNAIDATSSAAIEEKIIALTDEAIFPPFIDGTQQVIKYYSKATGQSYQIDFDGQNKKFLSDKRLAGLSGTTWSPDGMKVITEIKKDSGRNFFLYDFASGKAIPLKNNLDTIVWQNTNKIFYKYFNPQTNERSLNVSNPDGSNWHKITDLPYKYVSIAPIPRTGLVSFWNSPDSGSETTMSSVSVLGGSQELILKGYFGADYLWNNIGSYLLVSHADQKNGSRMELGITNDHGGEFKNLGIETFSSKVTWSKDNKTLYYALPDSLQSALTMPNDYLSKKISTRDSFWKINVLTGEKTPLLKADQIDAKIDAASLQLNADESALFFINRLDDKLYKINL